MRRALTIMLPVVVVGVVGALVAIRAHEGDAAFVLDQQHPTRVEPQALAAVVKKAREPLPSGAGPRAESVRCKAGSGSAVGNPWTCVVRYQSGDTIRYRITVDPTGAFVGSDSSGEHVVRGCCVGGGAT